MPGAGLCGPHPCSGPRTDTGSAPVRGAPWEVHTTLLTAQARERHSEPNPTDHGPEGTETESTVAQ